MTKTERRIIAFGLAIIMCFSLIHVNGMMVQASNYLENAIEIAELGQNETVLKESDAGKLYEFQPETTGEYHF